MRWKADGLKEILHLDYFAKSQQSNRVCFIDRHEYWARDYDLGMYMRTNRRLTKTFVRWPNAEIFTIPPCDLPIICVLLHD